MTRLYLDLDAKDALYMFHEHNVFIGRKVTIIGSGSSFEYECAGRSDTAPECAILLKDGVFHSKTVAFDRLELSAIKTLPDFPEGYKALSPVAYTADEATEQFALLMVQAARFFELMPTGPETREEVERLMKARGEGGDGSVVVPALDYYDSATLWYKNDAEKWGD